jgi:glutamate formiminotransferase
MRLLCVANWSEGRNRSLLESMRAALRNHGASVHFDGSDEDHNRIVTAFSGDELTVRKTLFSVAGIAFSGIDMTRHNGVHPRIGALDVCPFILLEGSTDEALLFAHRVGYELANDYNLPVFLYEKSETGKHAADLPSLRRGQYEALRTRELDPDFGPLNGSEKLGATVIGVRDWLIAMNVNFSGNHFDNVRRIAREIRTSRDDGDPRFAGVRALGLRLSRRSLAQVSMNLTLPDQTSPDEIVEWLRSKHTVVSAELIGVIRRSDTDKATNLPIEPRQIIPV